VTIKRREFLTGGIAGLGSLAGGLARADRRGIGWGGAGLVGWPPSGTGSSRPAVLATAALSIYHIHTAEALDVTYREDGVLVPGALEEIDRVLRDFRTGESIAMQVELLDTLTLLRDGFGGRGRGRYEIISGYRSPRTNAALRRVTSGVAENSLHIRGRAIDVRLVGTPTERLRDAALALKRGGVGYYADSNFVHVDTGAVRSW
jgi:uncharacterized protein YcbK (DUF882 family)